MSVTQTQITVSPPSAPGSASVTKSKGPTEDKNNEKLMVRFFRFLYIFKWLYYIYTGFLVSLYCDYERLF